MIRNKRSRLVFVMIVMVLLVAMPVATAFADASGPRNAGAGATGGGAGTAWTNPGNITADDTSYATVAPGFLGTSETLNGTSYGFAIPANATINGIQVSIMRQSSSTGSGFSIRDSSVRLIKGGTITGDNKAIAADWPNSMAAANYGSTSDLWGTTWTPAEINAANFGVALAVVDEGASRTASVDYMQITVTYTPPTPTTLSVSAASGTYGSTASLTATLTVTAGGAPVSGKTIAFTLNGVAAGTATTNGSGVATIPAASLVGINANTYGTGVGAKLCGRCHLRRQQRHCQSDSQSAPDHGDGGDRHQGL